MTRRTDETTPLREAALSDVGAWGSGGTPSSEHAEYYGGAIPWVTITDLKDAVVTETERNLTELGYRNSSAKWVPEDALLVAMYGASIGKLGIAGVKCTTNQAVAFCVPHKGIADTRYLFWALRWRREELRRLGQGGAQPNISQGILKSFRIPLPPIASQQRIAMALDLSFETISKCRTDLQRASALTDRYFSALRGAAYDPDSTTSRNLGINADMWAYQRFFEALDLRGGSQPPKSTFSERPAPGLIRLLQIRDFTSDNRAVYIKDGPAWRKCAEDDILVARYGASVGKILRGKAGAYNVALTKVIFSRGVIHPDFLYHWLHTSTFQDTLHGVSRSAQNGFNKDDLRNIMVPVPPLAQQQRIVDFLNQAAAVARNTKDDIASALRLLDHLETQTLERALNQHLPHSASIDSQQRARQAKATGNPNRLRLKHAIST